MVTIGQPERTTQERVIALFRDEFGYRSLGICTKWPYNSGRSTHGNPFIALNCRT